MLRMFKGQPESRLRAPADGRLTIVVLVLFGLFFGELPSRAQSGSKIALVGMAPTANASRVQSNIALQLEFDAEVTPARLRSETFSSLNPASVVVVGQVSGRHRWKAIQGDSPKKLTVQIENPFAKAEDVQVTVTSLVNPNGGDAISVGRSWSFSTGPSRGVGQFEKLQTIPISGNYERMLLFSADLNGDGLPDLIATSYGTKQALIFTNSTGNGFILSQTLDLPIGPGNEYYAPHQPAVGDLDGDGFPDLVFPDPATSDSPNGRVVVLLNDRTGRFGATSTVTTGRSPSAVAVADLDNDGRLDLIVANGLAKDLQIFRGTGAATFEPWSHNALGDDPRWITVADLNGDGMPDVLAVCRASYFVSVFSNSPANPATLSLTTNLPTSVDPNFVAVSRWSGSTNLDLHVTHFYGKDIRPFTNNGSGRFAAATDITSTRTEGLAILDADADGLPDLVSTSKDTLSISILKGLGMSGIQLIQQLPVGTTPFRVVSGDWDRDGALDFAVIESGKLVIYRNATVNLVAQPSDFAVLKGQPVHLEVTCVGGGPLTYQWFRNESLISDATSAQLVFPAALPGQQGTYRVSITGAHETVNSSPFVLTVLVPPEFLTQPANQIVREGKDVELTASVTGNPTPILQWWFNDSVPLPGETSPTLKLPAISRTKAGKYTLVAQNGVATNRSAGATIDVQFPPSFLVQPIGQTVNDGDHLSIQVNATGNPSPTFQWQHGPLLLPDQTNGVLMISVVSTNDAGVYKVIASNPLGSATSDPIRVDVFQTAPIIGNPPSSQSVGEGDEVTFNIVANAVPKASYQWLFNGSPIPGETATNLVIADVHPFDAGRYTVQVSNSVGSVVTDPAILTIHPSLRSLGTALDEPLISVWLSLFSKPWFYQTNVTHDAVDAAQAGKIGDGQNSDLSATVSGPAKLTFWWKVSSEQDFDTLQFRLDDKLINAISGEVDWKLMSVDVPSGLHEVHWVYAKDGRGSAGKDTGWVDQVSLIQGPSTLPYLPLSLVQRKADGFWQIRVNGVRTPTYGFDRSDDLFSWLPLTNGVPTEGDTRVVDRTSGGEVRRFYRLR